MRLAPFAGAHIGVALADFFQDRQQHRHCGLGHGEAVGFGRRMADQNSKVRRRLDIHVVDADGVFGDDAQPLRRLHDAAADGSLADRGAHERDRLARGGGEGVFVRAARQLPGPIADRDLAAGAFKRREDGLRLLTRREDQNFRLRHGSNSSI